MTVLLQCGHVLYIVSDEYPEWWACPHCGMSVRVQAFECREWKANCNNCRYARWFGQDKVSADFAHRKSGHVVSVHYVVHPDKRDAVRKLYGRKVALIVPDVPIGKRWAEMRSHVPARDTTIQSDATDDVPPF